MKRITFATGMALIAAACIAPSAPAWAHGGLGEGIAAGFAHPFSGIDHWLAMLAVGLWAATRAGIVRWVWPLCFVAAMAGGFWLAQSALPVPMLEPMIASTVILLGAAVALRFAAPPVVGAGIIALAGLLHGFAHGLELKGDAAGFAVGFALATVALHGLGFAAAIAARAAGLRWLAPAAGAAIATAGLSLLA